MAIEWMKDKYRRGNVLYNKSYGGSWTDDIYICFFSEKLDKVKVEVEVKEKVKAKIPVFKWRKIYTKYGCSHIIPESDCILRCIRICLGVLVNNFFHRWGHSSRHIAGKDPLLISSRYGQICGNIS